MSTARISIGTMVLVAGLAATAAVNAQGIAGGTGGSKTAAASAGSKNGQAATTVAALMASIHVTQAQQARIDSVSKSYVDSTAAITFAFLKASGASDANAAAKASAPASKKPAGAPSLPDSVQSKIDTLNSHRNARIRTLLDPAQQKLWDKAVADAAAAAAAIKRGGGEEAVTSRSLGNALP